MNFKKCLIIILILTIAAVSISSVSAGLFDFLSDDSDENQSSDDYTFSKPIVTVDDTLIKSSMNLKYSKPVKSTTYAYFYEDSGEYAEAAYWAPWYFTATFKLDVEKIYEMEFGDDSNYTLDMFKKDLKYMVKHDDVFIDNVDLNTDYFLNINNSATTSELKKNSTVLVIKCDYAHEKYEDKYIKTRAKNMKKASAADVEIRLNKNLKHNFKTGDDDIELEYKNLPLKVSKVN